MPLRTYICQQNQLGDVEHVHAAVAADIDLSMRIFQRMRSHKPALLWFHRVSGTSCSVVANLFATSARIEHLLCSSDRTLTQRLSALPPHVRTWEDFCTHIRTDYAVLTTPPGARAYSSVALNSLHELPQVRYWEGDSHPYFSLATLFSRAWGTTEINAGIYRLCVVGPHTLTVNWRAGSRAHAAWQGYAARAERMPVTIALGVDPTLTFASLFPLPASGSELSFWNFIRAGRQQINVNAAGLPLPPGAEVVLQGYVDPTQLQHEGSYANHTGFYTRSVPCPIIQVEQICMRSNAIIPVTLVGPPPTESALLGTQVWQLLAVLLQRECPFILTLTSPPETSHLPVLIIQVSAPATALIWERWRNIVLDHPILGRAHTLILVDTTTDTANFRHMYWHCMNQELECYTNPRPGLRLVDGVSWRFKGKKKVKLPF